MIEVVGDLGPRTEAVAVYVPGTGTNLDMSHVNTDVAVDLVEQAAHAVGLGVVEVHPVGPAGEDAGRVRRRTGMAEEDAVGHGPRLRAS